MTATYRIAYFLTPTEFGGAEKVSLNFLQNVNKDLFEIHPILLFRPWEGDTFFLKELKRAYSSIFKIPVSFGKQDHLWAIRCFRMICSFLRKGHFDLLHTHGYFADIIGIIPSNILKIPTLSTCHGFIENDKKLSLYNRLDRIVLRFTDKIIAVSTDIQKDLIESGIKFSQIRIIPNAIPTDIDEASFSKHRQEARQRFGFSEEDFVLGFVGRLSQEKGVASLIEAAFLARNANCPVKLLLIGEGPQKPELRDTVKRKRFETNVVFAGFQNNIDRLLPGIDVFVLPSLTEGTPMALLEAMAYGIPAIASSVGQIPQIVDSGKSGILVRPGNPQQIGESISFLYENPSIRDEIAKAGQRKVKKEFDIKRWTKQIQDEYIFLIAENPRKR
jgi:glycosyltransferase involved in cell wall biosynthesis